MFLYPNLSLPHFQFFGTIQSFEFELDHFHAFRKKQSIKKKTKNIKTKQTTSAHIQYTWYK